MTVFINGRAAVFQNSQGILRTIDPCYDRSQDVVNYSNIAQTQDAAQTAKTVFVNGYPLCHEKSVFSCSYGDESANLGVNSNSIQGQAEFFTASSDVFAEGLSLVRDRDLMRSNNRNTALAPLMQPGSFVPAVIQGLALSDQLLNLEYQLSFDVLGQSCSNTLIDVHQSQYSNQILVDSAGLPELSTDLKRRLVVAVLQKQADLALIIPNSVDDLIVPLYHVFSELKAAAVSKGAAANILVPIHILWATYPTNGELTIQQGDLSDIFRFPATIRRLVYKQLDFQAALLSTQVWMNLISSSLQQLIDEAVKIQYWPAPSGFLYIFVNGYLWREFQISKGGICEVNLADFAGADTRPATALRQNQIVLPYKIDENIWRCEFAYATVPWSWQCINDFGGMDPKDPRIQPRIPMPNAQQLSQAAAQRQQRFQCLELSVFADHMPVSVTQTDTSTLKVLHADYLPSLLLSNPIAIIKRALQDLGAAWRSLADSLRESKATDNCKNRIQYLQKAVLGLLQKDAWLHRPLNFKIMLQDFFRCNANLAAAAEILALILVQTALDPEIEDLADDQEFPLKSQGWSYLESFLGSVLKPLLFFSSQKNIVLIRYQADSIIELRYSVEFYLESLQQLIARLRAQVVIQDSEYAELKNLLKPLGRLAVHP